jgi:hypothetical protein
MGRVPKGTDSTAASTTRVKTKSKHNGRIPGGTDSKKRGRVPGGTDVHTRGRVPGGTD